MPVRKHGELPPMINLAQLDTAAQILIQQGETRATLNDTEAKLVTDEVVAQLLERFAKKVTIDGTPVTELTFTESTRNGRPTLTADIQAKVTEPLRTNLHVRINLQNDLGKPGKLQMTGLTAEPSFLNPIVRREMSAPEVTFAKALGVQMEHRHVTLTNASFEITDDSLIIGLMGGATQRQI